MTDISCIGVSAPGVIAKDSQVISKAAENVRIMYLTNVNLEIKKRLHVPVSTMNDGKAAGYCEFKIGNGKGRKSSAYFIIGTGVGGCICDENGIIEGVDRIAGEFSNLPIGYLDESRPFKLVGLAKAASITALVNLYNEKAGTSLEYGQEVSERYLAGDEKAAETVHLWCKNIIQGMYMIIMLYNPEILCIGGGISDADWFMKKLLDMYRNEIKLISEPPITTQIVNCKYTSDANILGAVIYAREHRTD